MPLILYRFAGYPVPRDKGLVGFLEPPNYGRLRSSEITLSASERPIF